MLAQDEVTASVVLHRPGAGVGGAAVELDDDFRLVPNSIDHEPGDQNVEHPDACGGAAPLASIA